MTSTDVRRDASSPLPGTVNIDVARADLVARGVDVSEAFHGTAFLPGTAGRIAGPDPEHRSYSSFVAFHDPGRYMEGLSKTVPN